MMLWVIFIGFIRNFGHLYLIVAEFVVEIKGLGVNFAK